MNKLHSAFLLCTTVIVLLVCEGCAHGQGRSDVTACWPNRSSILFAEQSGKSEWEQGVPVHSSNTPNYGSTNQMSQRYVPLDAMTNALSLMDQIVEARCVYLLGLYRLVRIRPIGFDVDWTELPKRAGLTRLELREIISELLYPIDIQVSYDEMLELVTRNELSGNRHDAETSMNGHISGIPRVNVPYDRIYLDEMTETERRLFLILNIHYRTIMLQEVESVVWNILSQKNNAMWCTEISEMLKGSEKQGP